MSNLRNWTSCWKTCFWNMLKKQTLKFNNCINIVLSLIFKQIWGTSKQVFTRKVFRTLWSFFYPIFLSFFAKYHHLELPLTQNKIVQKAHSPMMFFEILTLAFRGRWGQRMFEVEFWDCDIKLIFATLQILILQWNLVIVNSGLSPILFANERFFLLPDWIIFSFITYN